MNISELPYIIDRLTIDNIKGEPYNNDNVFLIIKNNKIFERNTYNDCIKKLREAIKSDHLNIEENNIIIQFCIKEYRRQFNAKDIKSFKGLLKYHYRRFVDHFTRISKPLTLLLKKDFKLV